MRGLFKLLGVMVACYVAYALVTGAIYARSGVWGKTFLRDENGFGYWAAVVSYGLLAVALVFIF